MYESHYLTSISSFICNVIVFISVPSNSYSNTFSIIDVSSNTSQSVGTKLSSSADICTTSGIYLPALSDTAKCKYRLPQLGGNKDEYRYHQLLLHGNGLMMSQRGYL